MLHLQLVIQGHGVWCLLQGMSNDLAWCEVTQTRLLYDQHDACVTAHYYADHNLLIRS